MWSLPLLYLVTLIVVVALYFPADGTRGRKPNHAVAGKLSLDSTHSRCTMATTLNQSLPLVHR